jgi:transposase-like protein
MKEMSDSLLSRIIDKIIPEIEEWQNRTLEPIYPIVYMKRKYLKLKMITVFIKTKLYIL